MTNRPGSVMEWRCSRPAAPRGAARALAARSPPGRWRRWRQAMENDRVARRREPSERRGGEGSPALSMGSMSVRHGCNGRQNRRRRKADSGAPLPGAPNVGSWVLAKPSRFEHWGAHEDLPHPIHVLASLRSQGLTRRTRDTRDTIFILVRATVLV